MVGLRHCAESSCKADVKRGRAEDRDIQTERERERERAQL